MVCADLFENLNAIHIRHANIQKHKIKGLIVKEFQGLPTVGRLPCAQSFSFQGPAYTVSNDSLIVNDKNILCVRLFVHSDSIITGRRILKVVP